MTEPIYNLRLLQKAILVQSNAETPDEVFAFIKQYRSEISATTPLVVMPTTYPQTTETDIAAAGANIVINANHLLKFSKLLNRR